MDGLCSVSDCFSVVSRRSYYSIHISLLVALGIRVT
jgi:hypothetical protein